MKMNRLFITSALLLGSLSALGMKSLNKNNELFSIGELETNTREVLRADGQTTVNPNDTTEPFVNPVPGTEAKNVSKSVAQVKEERYKKDDVIPEGKKEGDLTGKKSLRFISAVNVNLIDDDGDNIADRVDEKGHFGFHVSYTQGEKTLNRNFEVNKYFLSLNAGSLKYCNKDLSGNKDVEGFLPIDSFVSDKLEEKNQDGGPVGPDRYNAFITLEIKNIPTEWQKLAIVAQPYYVAGDGTKKYASNYRIASCEGKPLFFEKSNNEYKRINDVTSDGFSLTRSVEAGSKLSIMNHYGETLKKYENNYLDILFGKTGEYSPTKTGNITFKYSTSDKLLKIEKPFITILFSAPNNGYWGDSTNIHYWNGSTGTTWPGEAMTYSFTNDDNQKVFYIDIDKNYNGVDFSNFNLKFHNNNGWETFNWENVNSDKGFYVENNNGQNLKTY